MSMPKKCTPPVVHSAGGPLQIETEMCLIEWFRPTPGYSTGGQGHLLPLFSTSLVLSVVVTPTPTLSPSESSPIVAW